MDYVFITMINMLNYNIKKIYSQYYPKIYHCEFKELKNHEEKKILFDFILLGLKKTPYDSELFVISAVMYYYMTNILEYNFYYDLMCFITYSKHKKKQINKIILSISFCDEKWASDIRKFSNNLP
jgi:hypothetical protein